MRQISIISLLPQFVEAYLEVGMLAKAARQRIVAYRAVDLRRFGSGARKQVDDTPYGGGGGMILRIEPLVAAIEEAQQLSAGSALVLLMTPRGKTFEQADARFLAESGRDLIIVGGRYEGYDERLVNWTDHQFSIGRYVLTGAELPALVAADSVVRLLDGVLGNPEGVLNESFSTAAAAVEYPQYTKPETFRDLRVPDILLSGNHGEIAAWRQAQSDSFKL